MGTAQSRSQLSSGDGKDVDSTPTPPPGPVSPRSVPAPELDEEESASQFVLVVTAPPGTGKHQLIGRFLDGNAGSMACVHLHGTLSSTEKGLLYPVVSMGAPSIEQAAGPRPPGTYWTAIHATHAALRAGKSVVIDADTAGAQQLRATGFPATYVFVAPATHEDLVAAVKEEYRGSRSKDWESGVALAEQEVGVMHTDAKLYDFRVGKGAGDDEDAEASLAACVPHAHVAQKVLAMPLPTLPHPSLARRTSMSEALPPASPSTGAGTPAATRAESATSAVPSAKPSTAPTMDLSPEDDGSEVPIPEGMARWKEHVAIVTGASSGIGAAVAQVLVAAGVSVIAAARREDRLTKLQVCCSVDTTPSIAAARREDRLTKLQDKVVARGGAGRALLPVVCDVTKEAEVHTLVDLCQSTFQRPPSILVNCAGVGRANGGLMDGDSDAWVQMLSTNVLAVALCNREVCDAMRAADKWGHIITISSMSGHRVPTGIGGGGFYAATKHAARAMTEGLRQEARDAGVPLRVSLVSPGVVHTEFFSAMSDGNKATIERYKNLPGLTAADVAQAVLFALAAPQGMEVNDVLVRPTQQVV